MWPWGSVVKYHSLLCLKAFNRDFTLFEVTDFQYVLLICITSTNTAWYGIVQTSDINVVYD